MTAALYNLAAVKVLWRRDLMRFWRQPGRVVGAIGQPLIFWFVIGMGMATTFTLPGALPGENISYMEYFFPGVVVMVLLFASIFASVSVIEDRHQGFLQAVLAGPSSRLSLVLGKCAGSASVALLQASLFLLLAPLAGFDLFSIHWPMVLLAMVVTAFGLTAMGFGVAWWLDSMQSYHAVQMVLLVPLWVISGAMFPPSSEAQPIFAAVMALNPVSYAVSAVRHGFYGGNAPAQTVLSSSGWLDLGVLTVFAVVCVIFAGMLCERRRV